MKTETPLQILNKAIIKRNNAATGIHSITIGLLVDIEDLDKVLGDDDKINELLNKWEKLG